MDSAKRLKVLVTHVPAGSGHEKAAHAIAHAMEKLPHPPEVRVLNALDGADPFYRFLFTRGYLFVIQRIQMIWGLLYHLTDLRFLHRASQWNHRISNLLHGRALRRIFLEEKPDVVIGTHFFPMEVAGALKARGELSARLVTAITDYLAHSLWMAEGIDGYVVASSQARDDLIARGIPAQSIRTFGIPIDPRFGNRLDRVSLRGKLGLSCDHFTILIASGGAGTGPVIEWVLALGCLKTPLQLLVVAGMNAALLDRLKTLGLAFPHPMKVYGFIDNMDELMEVSDLMVTKPGGLSCAEAMVKGLPLLLTSPIPGQESRNAEFLADAGVALLAGSPKEVSLRVKQILDNPSVLQSLREKARAMARPEAASKTVEYALS